MSRIIKNYAYNLAYQLIILLLPILTAPYMTRILGAEALGVFGYVHSTAALIATFAMLGIFQYGSRQIAYVRDDPELLNKVFWRIMSARIVLATVGSVLYALAVLVMGRYRTGFFLYYTYLLGVFLDCTWLFVGVEDMKWAVLKNAFMKLGSTACIFLFVKKAEHVGVYLLIQGLSVLVANLAAYTQLRRYLKKPCFDLNSLWRDLIGSAVLFLPTAAHTVYLQCDKIMIEWLTGAVEQVAYYDYAEKIVLIPLGFITVLSTVMMPRLANEFEKGHADIISQLLGKAARISLFMAFPLMFGLLAAADKFVPWYLGADFGPAVTAICLLAPIVVTNSLSGISGDQFFTATNQITILIKAQVSAAVLNVVVNALLIPRLGCRGAAIATVASSVICAAVQYRFLLKQLHLPGLLRNAATYGGGALVMFLILRLITRNMAASPLTSVVQLLLGAVTYFVICLTVRDRTVLDVASSVKKMVGR